MNQITIEASPFIDVVEKTKKAKDELYGLRFDFSFVANKLGAYPQKMGGFWESDSGFEKRLQDWITEEKKVLFDGWSCKDMLHFQELTYKASNIIITIETNEYEVNYSGRKFLFPVLPETIDEFITDLKRIGITVFWKAENADIYGIDSITSNTKIIDYYKVIKNHYKITNSFNGSSS